MDELKHLITASHNPNLVKPNESPNGNIIYHIYSDGEITEQKGGSAYLQRSERTLQYCLYGINVDPAIFPNKRATDYNTFGYAIVTREDAVKIRDAMNKLR